MQAITALPVRTSNSSSFTRTQIKLLLLPIRLPGSLTTGAPVATLTTSSDGVQKPGSNEYVWNNPGLVFKLETAASVDVELWGNGKVVSSKRLYGGQLSNLTEGRAVTLSWKLHHPSNTEENTGNLEILFIRSTKPPANASIITPAPNTIPTPIPSPLSGSTPIPGAMTNTVSNTDKSNSDDEFNDLQSLLEQLQDTESSSSQGNVGAAISKSSSSLRSTAWLSATTPTNPILSTAPSKTAFLLYGDANRSFKTNQVWEESPSNYPNLPNTQATPSSASSYKLFQADLPFDNMNTRFLRIAMSMFGAIAIADDGSLHHWSYDSLKHNFIAGGPVHALNSLTIVDIAAGHDHFLAVTADGDLFGWGANQYNQICPIDSPFIDTPLKLNFQGVLSCAAGPYSSMALDHYGRAYSWGRAQMAIKTLVSKDNQLNVLDPATGRQRTLPSKQVSLVDCLGHGEAEMSARTNPAIASIPIPVVLPDGVTANQASISATMGVIVSRAGQVYAWGDANAICGETEESYAPVPVLIPFPEDVRILKALAGSKHILALDANGNLWWWGHRFYAAYPSSFQGASKPTKLEFPDSIADFGMSQKLSFALTSKFELFIWEATKSPELVPIAADLGTVTAVGHGPSSQMERFAITGERGFSANPPGASSSFIFDDEYENMLDEALSELSDTDVSISEGER